ncbi:glycosyltransferase family 2 protein [Arthrobacter sp. ISL-69]|uniref:glycosyltransferase family 2 protein n=1 Tax=Arthrobacter sp. ISL-69 TaxID=2819113 RepID=UPI001BE8A60B|nr:glycosyltransferase family 2 protein [Arthrobacter sp. ISL-69]MBT2535310.1 glycosyltransferase family 2 protein [Arthrobacter sp. ISL-69]
MNPTVTVVMPIYNNEDFVARAVHSVLDQSFKDFEVIIIDDSSTDRSLSTVRQAVDERPESDRDKVHIIGREHNLGYSAATNTGVGLARGRWIWFVDGDDWAEPEMLRRLVDAARSHAAQIAVSRIRTVRVATGAAKILPEWAPRASVATGVESLKHLARGDIGSFQTNKLVSKDIWDGVVSPGNAYGDLAIMPKLFSRSERVAFVDEPLYNYSLHSGSVTGALRPSMWDLTALHSFVDPILDEVFAPRVARALRKHFAYRLVYWPLIHNSAADISSGVLAEEIQSWTRHQIRWSELLWLVARGRVALVASLGLAKGSPHLHRKLFRYYKGRTS